MKSAILVIMSMLLALSCDTSSQAGLTRAFRITADDQLIGGPKALGTIGDYRIENDKIRVIIHGPGPNRGSTIFAGTIIDADLQRPSEDELQGFDTLSEVTPSFLFEGFRPTSFEILQDGSDGQEAIVRVEGKGGNFLQSAFLANAALLFSEALSFQVDYILHPGNQHIEIRTTLINDSGTVHPFPYLEASELVDFGLDIPGIESLELSVPLGHLVVFGDGVFAPGAAGFNVRFAIDEAYGLSDGLPALPGLTAPFFAKRSHKVSYGILTPPGPSNYVRAFSSLYQKQNPPTDGMVIPFLFAGFAPVFVANPPPILEHREEFTYTSYLAVGNGDIASISDIYYEMQQTPTGTFAARVLEKPSLVPARDASIIIQNVAGHYITQATPDPGGDVLVQLPGGDYTYSVVSRNRNLIRDRPFTIVNDQTTFRQITPSAPGYIQLSVRDELGRAAPSKARLVGNYASQFSGTDPRGFLYSLALGESLRPTTGVVGDNRYIENTWYLQKGFLSVAAMPGDYNLVVSRGTEYEIQSIPVQIRSGKTASVDVTLERAFSSPGYVAADLHLHATNSPDSSLSLTDRIISLVGEDIEFAAATDHNAFTDYDPAIASTDLKDWITATVGVEVTSIEMGHFNGYPLNYNPASIRGGDILWAGKTPDEIFRQIRANARYGPKDVVVQVNHGRNGVLGYFEAFNVNQETMAAEVASSVSAIFTPSGDEFAIENFSLDFDAVEVLNGKAMEFLHTYRVPDPLPPPPYPEGADLTPGTVLRDIDGNIAYPGLVEDWFTLLNRGGRMAVIGTSDSHNNTGEEPGYARSYIWVGEGNDQQGLFDDYDITQGIKNSRTITTTGPMIEFFVQNMPLGSTVSQNPGPVEITIRAKASSWAPMDELIVYANGEPTFELPLVGAQRTAFETTISIPITQDTWFVAEVVGNTNMFPVVTPQEFPPFQASNVLEGLGDSIDVSSFLGPDTQLRPQLTYPMTPFAITSPIWVDVDGNGEYDPSDIYEPLAEQVTSLGGKSQNNDIYELFEGLRQ